MKPEECKALFALLHTLRRQLWRQAISRWWWWGWGGTAVLLAGAGLVHTLLWPLPFAQCIGLAMAPPLLALAVGLWWGRPSLASCAWLADQRFDGKSLLTSAWDLLSRPQAVSPASACLLLSQANRAAVVWQGRLTAQRSVNPPRQAVLSFSLSLVGLFLLSSPGALLHSTAASAVARDSTAPAMAAEPVDDAWASASAGKKAVSPSTSASIVPVFGNEQTGGEAATAERSAGTRPLSPAPPLDKSAVPVDRQPGQMATAVSPAAAHVPTVGTGQVASNDHPGNDRDGQPAATRTPAANPTIRYLDIERRAGAAAQTASSQSEGLAPVEPALHPPAAVAAVPAERVAMPYETIPEPALRRYVADYFQESEHD